MSSNGKIEKHILRQAFEDYLPEEVAWRQKEQFSDGVGYSWIDTLKEIAERQVSDDQMANVHHRFLSTHLYQRGICIPKHLFRVIPSDSAALCVPSVPSVACSTPVALAWDDFQKNADPSGRSVAWFMSIAM